jgi:hypothetical protein
MPEKKPLGPQPDWQWVSEPCTIENLADAPILKELSCPASFEAA